MTTNLHDEDFMLRTYDHTLKKIVPIHFHGRRLAHATSRRRTHTHPRRHWALPKERCSACRWFETSIYVVTESDTLTDQTPGSYVLETQGRTIVEGEHDRFRVRVFTDPWVVVAKLMKRVNGEVFLPGVSRTVLEEAAEHDEKIKHALATVCDQRHLTLGDLRPSADQRRRLIDQLAEAQSHTYDGEDEYDEEDDDYDRWNLIDADEPRRVV